SIRIGSGSSEVGGNSAPVIASDPGPLDAEGSLTRPGEVKPASSVPTAGDDDGDGFSFTPPPQCRVASSVLSTVVVSVEVDRPKLRYENAMAHSVDHQRDGPKDRHLPFNGTAAGAAMEGGCGCAFALTEQTPARHSRETCRVLPRALISPRAAARQETVTKQPSP